MTGRHEHGREHDVHLTDHERATFAELERQLTGPSRRRRMLSVLAIAAVVVGIGLLVGGLIGNAPAIAAAGFVVVVVGLAAITHRVTTVALVRWWRAGGRQR